MQENNIHQLEISIEHAKELVAKGDRLRTLVADPLWKEFVDDGYMLREAARLAILSSEPNIPANVREDVSRDLNGPGAFMRYLRVILQQAYMAKEELASAQEMLSEELLAEQETE